MNNEKLKNELKKIFKTFKTKPVLFVGSGISKRYLDLPDWKSLLTLYATKITDNRFPFRIYERNALRELEKMNLNISEKLPIVASLIKTDYEDMFFDNDELESDLKERYETDINDGLSPFKIALSDYFLKSIANTDAYTLEKENFEKLNNKVSNIITTNYDTFLENQFSTYNVFVGQKDLLNKRMNRIGNIFKIHGSATEPSSLVITKEDYDLFNESQKFLTAKLLTFFYRISNYFYWV